MPYVFVIALVIRENLVLLLENEAVSYSNTELMFKKANPKIKTFFQYCRLFSLSYVDT